jgi:hypothetical protein
MPGMELLSRGPLKLGAMKEFDVGKLDWVGSLPTGPPAKDGLARIVDADGGRYDPENLYHQAAAYPSFVQIEAARRRFRGQFRRRLKRLAERARLSGSVTITAARGNPRAPGAVALIMVLDVNG